MKPIQVEVLLLVALAAASTGAARRWVTAVPSTPLTRPLPGLAASRSLRFDRDSLREYAGIAVTNDPFRLSNEPPVTQTAIRTAPQSVAPPRPPYPALTLKAIVGGPPWQAIVAGLPGQAGDAVVSSGARFDAITVGRITGDTVLLRAKDTTWTLVMKRGAP